jgi:hypothetical protein
MAHMLVDCGVLKGTEDGKARMRAVVADIVKTTEGRLDVLVVTHEHWDHVSGFVQAAEEFRQLEIGEVWLAWTEGPDELAQALLEQRVNARRAVDAAREKMKLSAAPAAQPVLQALDAISSFSGDFGAAGRHTTSAAMTWARAGTGVEPQYLSPGGEPRLVPGLDSVRAFVLGPPKDTRYLKRSDPSKRAPEVYQLAGGMDLGFMAALAGLEGADSGRPFHASFEKPVERAKEDGFFREFYYSADEWRQIDFDWLGTAERLALQLDSDTNNTSLVLAIELIESGRVMLFPGDAQVGNWLSWELLEWTVKDRRGEPARVTTQDLVARTVLYKVSHHASHNATLREQGLELMGSPELVAMVPVYEEQAHRQGKDGWEMPFPPLLNRLQQKTSGRVLRADAGLPLPWPKLLAQRHTENDDYIDYMIDM